MKTRILLFFAVMAIGITAVYFITPKKNYNQQLPILQPKDLNSEMVDPALLQKGLGHRIGEFSFKNQEGKTITLADVKGKTFIAEYFFTTCASICPIMNKQMMRVQEAFSRRKDVAILSFTVDPEIDTVAQMKKHAQELGAKTGFWHLLTGDKMQLYKLARNSFFLLKPAEAVNQGDANSDFIHTTNFVLVDKQLRIRGYYDGTNVKEVDKLIKDVVRLDEE